MAGMFTGIQLSDQFDAIILPPDMAWTDEFEWTPVVQDANHTLTGALIVECAEKQTGRPITLQSGDDRAWITGDKLQLLQTWAARAGGYFGLVIRGQMRTVIFRHQDAPALEAEPVMFHGDEPGTGEFKVTIKLQEIDLTSWHNPPAPAPDPAPDPDPDPQPDP